MPYVQFESVDDFIPSLGAQSLLWGYKQKGERWGGTRGLVKLWSEGPRVMEAPLCAKCLNVCCSLGSLVVRIVCVVRVVVY